MNSEVVIERVRLATETSRRMGPGAPGRRRAAEGNGTSTLS